MFTIDQIKEAHSHVKSGADFPRYIQDLIKLGVARYETFVSDGHTEYQGLNLFKTQSDARYAMLTIANQADKEQFIQDLKTHQQSKTDYMTFCNDCAKSGIKKWIVDLSEMTCIYYDTTGQKILAETIPTP